MKVMYLLKNNFPKLAQEESENLNSLKSIEET